ncbi:Wiskott-Aldrich syndrome 1 [Sparassis crispa]|uniref:Wiskott-Aldrich syndrome 1 n=1 Tax=Sparassis crispa TaxID=139825 RepID=A0A401GP79_9APHY|nr:Wiskott-Aldrich syndrome 1 [Sparassis crispa]GBE83564.1 Wiskott-Aldrich syndrome 1 [Sparassis crispa]
MFDSSAAKPPSASSLTDSEKRHVLSLLPPESRVVAVASARVYHAPFKGRGDDWAYSGLQGLLVLGAAVHSEKKLGSNHETSFVQNYWFRLIDTASGRGVIWSHSIPVGFDYRLDKPFFHYFSGKSRMFGFRFEDDDEAEKFYRKVTSRVRTTVPPSRRKPLPPTPQNQISSAVISSPSPETCIHVAHMGYNEQGYIEATGNLPPRWKMVLKELQGHSVTKKMVDDDIEFVDGFWVGVKAVRAAAPKPEPVQTPSAQKRRKTVHRKPVQVP